CALDDVDAWRTANPALGDFLHMDALETTVRTTPEASFRRYRLGQWVGAADSWLPWGAWDECSGDPDLPDEGTTVVLAFDGSAAGWARWWAQPTPGWRGEGGTRAPVTLSFPTRGLPWCSRSTVPLPVTRRRSSAESGRRARRSGLTCSPSDCV